MSLPLAPPTSWGEISILRSLWMKFYGVIIYLIKSIQQELLLFRILLYLVLFRFVSKFFNERFLFRCIMEISPEALNFTLGKSVTQKAAAPSSTAICRWVKWVIWPTYFRSLKKDMLWSTFDFPRILCIISLITLFFHRQKS